nr:unnamed protein product [Callosobruchus chinensis]
MATRRTRIKAVANIHQRRKNVEETITKSEELEISVKDSASGKVNSYTNDLSVSEESKGNSEDKEAVGSSHASNSIEVNNDNISQQASEPIDGDTIKGSRSSKDVEFLHPATVLDAPIQNNKEVEFLKPININNSYRSDVEKDAVHITTIAEHRESTQQLITTKNTAVLENICTSDKDYNDTLQAIQQNDNEYQRPPPSPTKINRSRIKAVPRLGYRKTSFSASESEDECKRNRNRNDSVCSVASIAASDAVTEPLPHHKPKETSYKKVVRTELTRKVAEARREFQRKFGYGKPDRQKLTMMDLIFYNPQDNPMVRDEKPKSRNESVSKNEEQPAPEPISTEMPPPTSNKESAVTEKETEMPVPQIKIGPTGEIIIDEQSLVVEREDIRRQREEIERQELIDGDFDTGYGIYKRHKRSKPWSHAETLRFYKALNSLGTDFTLMTDLFPSRTRRELKMKFLREEKSNKALIDRALTQPCKFNYTELKREVDIEEKELEEMRRQQEDDNRRKKEKHAEKPRKKGLTVQAENEARESASKLRKKIHSRVLPSSLKANNDLREIDSSEETSDMHSRASLEETSDTYRRVSMEEASGVNAMMVVEKTAEAHDEGVKESFHQHTVDNVSEPSYVENEHSARSNGDINQKSDLENNTDENPHQRMQRKRRSSTENQKAQKIRRKRDKKKTNVETITEDSDADESDIASISESDEELILPSKPTRSGRMPKITKKYMAEREVLRKNVKSRDTENIEPGSIMVIAEDGPNSEPIYKIFMITPDNGKKPVNLSPDSISRAIQLKKGISGKLCVYGCRQRYNVCLQFF